MEFPPRFFTAEGRPKGSYVYFLCCAGDVPDVVYIKVGISDIPGKRLFSLVNNCALRPLTFGICNVLSRRVAQEIEINLHRALKKWRTNGEWFRFKREDKTEFALIRDRVLAPYRNSAWPMAIEVQGVMPVIKHAKKRSKCWVYHAKQAGAFA